MKKATDNPLNLIQDSPCGEYFFSAQDNIYSNTIFSRFFEQNDKEVMAWAENVLAKLEGNGILPVFLKKKENEDFKAFWGTITHLFALIVLYARKYKEIDSNQILFETFIQNRGLITNLVDSQDQMEYLFYNYLEEYSKRGRLDIINKEGELLGELLRLIRYNSLDEFIFALLRPENTGWTIGHSSPTWQRTECVTNVTKAFEYSIGVDDLEKYPLLLPQNISITQDENGEDSGIFNAMTFTGTQTVGIDGREDLSKLIIIDPNLSYEISAMIKVSKAVDENLKFGVAGYETTDGEALAMGVIGGEDSMFFHTSEYMNLPNENIYYHIKGILFSNTIQFKEVPTLNFSTGRALSLKSNMKYIAPILIQERTDSITGQPYVYIYDFKVKPLDLPFQQGYLGAKEVIAAYYKNNAYQKQKSIESYMKKYLLGYKNILGATVIEDIEGDERYRILFKVFSDRNRYISKATIKINGKTLITDVNGEASIILPRGEWKYIVEAENFGTTERVLIVEKDTVEYVQLIGSAYERVVTFYVRDSETKDFLSGVKVTFGGKTAITSSSGIVVFEVYPGTYQLSAEKESYYTEKRTLEVTDSVNVDINMRAIEHYNVTIRVRDGVNPVGGASVLVTGDDYERTTSTNDQGQATGFSLVAGTYRYKIVKDGYLTKEGEFTIYDDAVIDVQFNPIPKYNINFIVTSNNLPVQKADVNFNGTTLQTDNNGKVTFVEIAGQYNWKVTKTEYASQTGTVNVIDEDVTVEVSLTQIGYSVTFTVKDEKGEVLSNARVSIGAENIDTSDQGIAVFVKTSGSYQWSVSKEGYYTKQGVVIVSGAGEEVEVTLEQVTYDIVFTVKAEGVIVKNQPVNLGGTTLNTDDSGIVTFNKPAGRYPWTVSRDAYDTQTGTAVVIDRSITVDVNLQKTKGTLSIVTLDSQENFPISGAIVTIQGQSKSTNDNGYAGEWSLVYGTYEVRASKSGYNPYTGSVTVDSKVLQKSIYMIKEAEKQYTITFTVKEGNSLVRGAQIKIYNSQIDETITTNSEGTATISLIKGTYNYICNAGEFFQTASGDFVVYGEMSVPINVVRKTTTVIIYTRDSASYEYIDGVRVQFGNYGTMTTAGGRATFYNVPLNNELVTAVASKEPQYENVVESFSVTRENPSYTIYMGLKKFNVTFIVRDDGNNYVSGASVLFNSTNQSTGSNGSTTFSQVPSNTSPYSWQVDKSGYQTKTGDVSVTDRDVTVNVTLTRIKCYITYIVQNSQGHNISGASVNDGIDSGITNSQGQVSWYVPSGASYTVNASHASYFSGSTNFTVSGNEQRKTVYITLSSSGALLEIEIDNSQELHRVNLPIVNNSSNGLNDLRVQWGDGIQTIGETGHNYSNKGTYRILFDFNGNNRTLMWGSGTEYSLKWYLKRVLAWFSSGVRTQFTAQGAFRDFNKLTTMVKWNTSLISGSTELFYCGCYNPHTVEDFAPLTWSSSGYYGAYSYSGLTGEVDLTTTFGGNTSTSFHDTFAGTQITAVTGKITPSSSGCNIHGMFYQCNKLTSIPSDMGFRYITDGGLCFGNCTSLTSTTQCELYGGSNVSVGQMYYACSSLSTMITNTFTAGSTSSQRTYDFNNCFAGSGLNVIQTNAFNVYFAHKKECVSMFSNTRNLYDISNLRTGMFNVINANFMFDYSVITGVPQQFFQSTSDLRSTCEGTFLNCENLKTANNIFTQSFRPTTVKRMFQNCRNLSKAGFGFYATEVYSGSLLQLSDQCGATTIKDYSYCFENCTALNASGVVIDISNGMQQSIYFINDRRYFSNYQTGLTTEGCFRGGPAEGTNCPNAWK